MTSLDDPSGRGLAEAAHAAGVVEVPDELPNHTVSVSFVVRGTPEHADAVALTLASELSARGDVAQPVMFSIEAHE